MPSRARVSNRNTPNSMEELSLVDQLTQGKAASMLRRVGAALVADLGKVPIYPSSSKVCGGLCLHSI